MTEIVKFNPFLFANTGKNDGFVSGSTNWGMIYVAALPTTNCQFFSIGEFRVVLREKDKQKQLQILVDCYKAGLKKKMVLLDVEEYWIGDLEKLFPSSDIVIKQPYISTNNSRMCLYLVKTTIVEKEYSRQLEEDEKALKVKS